MSRYVAVGNVSRYIHAITGDFEKDLSPIDFMKAVDAAIGASHKYAYETVTRHVLGKASGYHIYKTDIDVVRDIVGRNKFESQATTEAVLRVCEYVSSVRILTNIH